MKKLTLTLGLAFLSFSSLYAQQEEVDAANKAFKNKDYNATIEKANQAIGLLKVSPVVEPEDLAELYYNAGRAAQSLDKIQVATNFFALLNRVETKPYFETKNKDTGKWEYYLYQSVAEKVAKEGNYSKVKKKKLSPKYIGKVIPELSNLANEDLKTATDAFQNKDYKTAFKKFAETYYLSRALGNPNELYLYYSALSGLQVEKLKPQAVKRLQFLADKNFDGVQTTYTAVNVSTGEKGSFSNKKDMEAQVKIGLYKDPKVEQSESLEKEMYNYLVYGYYQLEDYENGIPAAQKALEKFPDNDAISQLLSSMYYKSGNTDKFVAELKEKVDNGTAVANDYFNLAKMLDDTKGNKEDIIKYYKTAIEKDPEMTNAYINLSLSIVKPEAEYIKLMNENLGSTAKEKKIYKENMTKRKKLYEEALPYLEKAYQLDSKNPNLIKILETAYDVVGNDTKFMEMKKKLESL